MTRRHRSIRLPAPRTVFVAALGLVLSGAGIEALVRFFAHMPQEVVFLRHMWTSISALLLAFVSYTALFLAEQSRRSEHPTPRILLKKSSTGESEILIANADRDAVVVIDASLHASDTKRRIEIDTTGLPATIAPGHEMAIRILEEAMPEPSAEASVEFWTPTGRDAVVAELEIR